jgi:hypothetical protein
MICRRTPCARPAAGSLCASKGVQLYSTAVGVSTADARNTVSGMPSLSLSLSVLSQRCPSGVWRSRREALAAAHANRIRPGCEESALTSSLYTDSNHARHQMRTIKFGRSRAKKRPRMSVQCSNRIPGLAYEMDCVIFGCDLELKWSLLHNGFCSLPSYVSSNFIERSAKAIR